MACVFLTFVIQEFTTTPDEQEKHKIHLLNTMDGRVKVDNCWGCREWIGEEKARGNGIS